jgi:hypothetical protein
LILKFKKAVTFGAAAVLLAAIRLLSAVVSAFAVLVICKVALRFLVVVMKRV